MGTQEPTTETLNTTDARRDFSQLLNQVYRREKRIVVEKSGIPVAAIVSITDLARLERLEEQRRQDMVVIDEMRAAFADVPREEHEREVAKAVAEVHAERRARDEARVSR